MPHCLRVVFLVALTASASTCAVDSANPPLPVDVAADATVRRDALPGVADAAATPTLGCATSTGSFACDDGICCDPSSGLEWVHDKSPIQPSWDAAVSYCDSLTLGGGGWRLANITELMSLTRGCAKRRGCPVCDTGATTCLDRACETDAACTQCDEPSTILNGQPTNCFWPDELGSCAQPGSTGSNPLVDPLTWSSSKLEGGIDPGAFYVHFSQRAFVHAFLLEAPGLARCVRGPKPTVCLTGQ